MSIFSKIGDYIADAQFLSSKGVDTNNSLAVDSEMEAIAKGDHLHSSLSHSDVETQQAHVNETGHIDTLQASIFDNLGGSNSSSDSSSSSDGGLFSSCNDSSRDSDSGSLFSRSDLFGSSNDGDDGGNGWW